MAGEAASASPAHLIPPALRLFLPHRRPFSASDTHVHPPHGCSSCCLSRVPGILLLWLLWAALLMIQVSLQWVGIQIVSSFWEGGTLPHYCLPCCYFLLLYPVYLFLTLLVDHNTCCGMLDAVLIFGVIECSLLIESLIPYAFFSGFLPTYWLFHLILLLRLLFCHCKVWCIPKPLPLVLCSCHSAHFPRRLSCTRGFRCDSRHVACLLSRSFRSGLAAVSDTGNTA